MSDFSADSGTSATTRSTGPEAVTIEAHLAIAGSLFKSDVRHARANAWVRQPSAFADPAIIVIRQQKSPNRPLTPKTSEASVANHVAWITKSSLLEGRRQLIGETSRARSS